MEFLLVCHKNEKSLPIGCYYNNQSYKWNNKTYTAQIIEIHYNENLAIGLGGLLPRNKALGYHDGDIERIVVLIDADGIPVRMFLSSHSQEGRWYPYDQIEKQNNVPVIYSAKGSHAMNNTPKARIRMLGFANDYFSNVKTGIKVPMVPKKDTGVSYDIWADEVLSSPLRAFLQPFYLPILPELKEEQKKKNTESQK